ncbi:MAG: filamentous hemagglutinin N-terminal domain-containing protein [Candidatus Pacebacteria bacterium]|nr:filamentous hemagglutinin N-terminal domain-containing protein [Candidatus Paceibacterota bacterium]
MKLFLNSTKRIALVGSAAVAAIMVFTASSAKAAPTGGTVAAGQAIIDIGASTTIVTQTSDRAVIDWQSFNLAADESAQFIVPAATSATLNRISRGITTISGTITSNGAVYFTNPNGLVFDATSQVTANGFFAATQAIAPSQFMAGGVSAATLTNLGRAELILNGSITASAITAMGGTVTVNGSLESLQGEVLVSSANLTTIGEAAVIRVDAAQNGNGGRAIIWSDNHTDFYGFISARGGSDSGDGGFVEVSGKETLNFNGLVNTLAENGKTGTLLLDPTDIIISSTALYLVTQITTAPAASSGTSTISSNDKKSWLTPTLIQTQLASSNVTINANSGTGTGSGLITVSNAIAAASSGSNSLTLTGAQIVIKSNITMTSGGNLILNANRASVWQDPSTVITANTISGVGVDGFNLNGANKFTTIGTITNRGTTGISVKNNQALGVTSGITLDGGTGGVSILAPEYDVTLNGGLTVIGSFLRLDMGSKNIKGVQTITATGLEVFYTSATTGNAASFNLGAGNFIFVTDNRATTTAAIINNSTALPTAFAIAGSGLTVTTTGTTNGQGVVYGGTVEIQGVTTGAAKSLRYIEGAGILVSTANSSFMGSLTLVASGAGTGGSYDNGVFIQNALTAGVAGDGTSNLTLIQSGSAAGNGILANSSTLSAGGNMTLTQSGSARYYGIDADRFSNLSAGGAMTLTQSGSVGYGITTSQSTLTAGGAVTLIQSGSAGYNGINSVQSTLTAGGDMTLTQSGIARDGISCDASYLTAGGVLTLTQSGSAGGDGIGFDGSTLTAGGAMTLTQSGGAMYDGISASHFILYAGGAMTLTQSGSAGRYGITASSSTMSAATDLSLIQSGTQGGSYGYGGIFLSSQAGLAVETALTFSAGANGFVTFKTNNQKLSLNGADNFVVTRGRVRIDLGTETITSGSNNTLNASGLDVYFTGASSGHSARIKAASFTVVTAASGDQSLTTPVATATVPTGLTVTDFFGNSLASIGTGYATSGVLTVSNGTTGYSYLEGSSISGTPAGSFNSVILASGNQALVKPWTPLSFGFYSGTAPASGTNGISNWLQISRFANVQTANYVFYGITAADTTRMITINTSGTVTFDGGSSFGKGLWLKASGLVLKSNTSITGGDVQLDLGINGVFNGSTYSLTANGLNVYYTSATSGNSGTIAVGSGSFTYVNDRRSVTRAVTLDNDTTASSAAIGWGNGLGTITSGIATASGLTVTGSGNLNGQGVVYGGTVDIQGIGSTSAAKNLRYIEGTGISVTNAASTFAGSLILVSSGRGNGVGGNAGTGIDIKQNLTVGVVGDKSSNLNLIQSGEVFNYGILVKSTILAGGDLSLTQSGSAGRDNGIYANNSTLTAGGAITLTQSGRAGSHGIYAYNSTLSAGGAMILTQSGSASTGINVDSSTLTAGGAMTLIQSGYAGGHGIHFERATLTAGETMTLTQSGSSAGNGINFERASLTAGGDLSLIQSGTMLYRAFGISLYSQAGSGAGTAQNFAAGAYGFVTFKTNNQNLSLTNADNFTVTRGRVRIDLGTGAMVSRDGNGNVIGDAANQYSLNASGLDVYYTGASSGHSAKIKAASFTVVTAAGGNQSLTRAAATATVPTGLTVSDSFGNSLASIGTGYATSGILTVSNATTGYSYLEGSSISGTPSGSLNSVTLATGKQALVKPWTPLSFGFYSGTAPASGTNGISNWLRIGRFANVPTANFVFYGITAADTTRLLTLNTSGTVTFDGGSSFGKGLWLKASGLVLKSNTSIAGGDVRIDLGSSGVFNGGAYSLTANGQNLYYTSAISGNSGTIAVGSGSFTYVNDRRNVTSAVTLDNSSTASSQTIGWGSGLGTIISGTATTAGFTVTGSGNLNGQGVVYGGTVDIQGITTGAAKDLRYIEATGISVTNAASTFAGSLILVASGGGTGVGGNSGTGIDIKQNLTTGVAGDKTSNLTLIQSGSVTGYGINAYGTTLTAGGAMTLTQSGSAGSEGIYASNSTLRADGAMTLTQSGSAGSDGIHARSSTLTVGGAMTLTQSGSAGRDGIYAQYSTLTAGGAMTLTQSGRAGSDGITASESTLTAGTDLSLIQSGTVESRIFDGIKFDSPFGTLNFAAGANGFVTFKTNGQKLSLNGADNLVVTRGRVRIDLDTGAMVSRDSYRSIIAVAANQYNLNATGLDVFYTGATTGNSAKIDVGSGNFIWVKANSGAATIDSTYIIPTRPTITGLTVTTSGSGTSNRVGVAYDGAVTISGASNNGLAYIEGSSITTSTTASTFNGGLVLRSSGAISLGANLSTTTADLLISGSGLTLTQAITTSGGNVAINLGAGNYNNGSGTGYIWTVGGNNNLTFNVGSVTAGSGTVFALGSGNLTATIATTRSFGSNSYFTNDATINANNIAAVTADATAEYHSLGELSTGLAGFGFTSSTGNISYGATTSYTTSATRVTLWNVTNGAISRSVTASEVIFAGANNSFSTGFTINTSASNGAVTLKTAVTTNGAVTLNLGTGTYGAGGYSLTTNNNGLNLTVGAITGTNNQDLFVLGSGSISGASSLGATTETGFTKYYDYKTGVANNRGDNQLASDPRVVGTRWKFYGSAVTSRAAEAGLVWLDLGSLAQGRVTQEFRADSVTTAGLDKTSGSGSFKFKSIQTSTSVYSQVTLDAGHEVTFVSVGSAGARAAVASGIASSTNKASKISFEGDNYFSASVSLYSTSTIGQSSGKIDLAAGNSLALNAGTTISLAGTTNNLVKLATLSAGSTISLASSTALTLSGSITANGAISISATALTLTSNVTSSGGAVTVNLGTGVYTNGATGFWLDTSNQNLTLKTGSISNTAATVIFKLGITGTLSYVDTTGVKNRVLRTGVQTKYTVGAGYTGVADTNLAAIEGASGTITNYSFKDGNTGGLTDSNATLNLPTAALAASGLVIGTKESVSDQGVATAGLLKDSSGNVNWVASKDASFNAPTNISLASGKAMVIAGVTSSSATTVSTFAPTSITISGTNSFTGALTLVASAGVTLGGSITTSGGYISIDTGSGIITVANGFSTASSGSNSLTLTGAQIVIKANITMVSGGNLSLNANRGSVWQDPSTVITANTISGVGVDGFNLNGANKFTTIGTITNHGGAGISVKNAQALAITSGITLDGGTGGVSILAPNFDVTLNGGLTVKGSFLRLDMGSKNIKGGQTITATGLDIFYTSATTGNAATLNLGAGNFIFVTDNRATTTATTIDNSTTLPTAFAIAGSGLTVTTTGTTNGQGVVYGGTVDIQGVNSSSTTGINNLRYIEGTGISVTTASSFAGSLTLVGSGSGTGGRNSYGIFIQNTLTAGVAGDGASNLTLIQSGSVSGYGIYAYESTLTAGGVMTLTQSGSAGSYGIYAYNSPLTAGGDMALTQSGSAGSDGINAYYSTLTADGDMTLTQSGIAGDIGIFAFRFTLTADGAMTLTQSGSARDDGILANSSTLTAGGSMTLTQSGSAGRDGITAYYSNLRAGGAMTLTQSGSAGYHGIYAISSTLTAAIDLSLIQSGTVGGGYDGIYLYSYVRSGVGTAQTFAAGANGFVTFKTNNQKLSLNGADNFAVTLGRVRIDLGTGMMVSKDNRGTVIAVAANQFSLNASGIDVFYTGATTGNSAKIDVGSGNFIWVEAKSGAATIGSTYRIPTRPTIDGLTVTTSGSGTSNRVGVAYDGAVTISGASNNGLAYIEGSSITTSTTASTFNGGLVLRSSGAISLGANLSTTTADLLISGSGLTLTQAITTSGGNVAINLGAGNYNNGSGTGYIWTVGGNNNLTFNVGSVTAGSGTVFALGSGNLTATIATTRSFGSNSYFTNDATINANNIAAVTADATAEYHSLGELSTGLAGFGFTSSTGNISYGATTSYTTSATRVTLWNVTNGAISRSVTASEVIFAGANNSFSTGFSIDTSASNGAVTLKTNVTAGGAVSLNLGTGIYTNDANGYILNTSGNGLSITAASISNTSAAVIFRLGAGNLTIGGGLTQGSSSQSQLTPSYSGGIVTATNQTQFTAATKYIFTSDSLPQNQAAGEFWFSGSALTAANLGTRTDTTRTTAQTSGLSATSGDIGWVTAGNSYDNPVTTTFTLGTNKAIVFNNLQLSTALDTTSLNPSSISLEGGNQFSSGLTLVTSGAISQAMGSSLTVSGANLVMSAGEGISLDRSGNDLGSLGAVTANGQIAITSANSISVTKNISSTNGTITITAAGMSLADNITTSGGALIINLGDATLDMKNHDLTTSNGNLNLTAGKIIGTTADVVIFKLGTGTLTKSDRLKPVAGDKITRYYAYLGEADDEPAIYVSDDNPNNSTFSWSFYSGARRAVHRNSDTLVWLPVAVLTNPSYGFKTRRLSGETSGLRESSSGNWVWLAGAKTEVGELIASNSHNRDMSFVNVTATADVMVKDSASIQFVGVNSFTALNLTSQGRVLQARNSRVTVTGLLNLGHVEALWLTNPLNQFREITGSTMGGSVSITTNGGGVLNISDLKTGGGSVVMVAPNGGIIGTGLVTGGVHFRAAGSVELRGTMASTSGTGSSVSIENNTAGWVVGNLTGDAMVNLYGRGEIILTGTVTSRGSSVAVQPAVKVVGEREIIAQSSLDVNRIDAMAGVKDTLKLYAGTAGVINLAVNIGEVTKLGWVEFYARDLNRLGSLPITVNLMTLPPLPSDSRKLRVP